MLIELANGFKIHSKPMPNSRTFICNLFVLSGTSQEESHTHGIAHLCEHLLFKGSSQWPSSKQLALALEKRGISLHAKTSRDFICFELLSQPEYALEGLDILMHMLFEPIFQTSDFENEIEVVLEELEMTIDNAEVLCRQELSKMMWGEDHPLGRSLLGTENSIRSLTLQHAHQFLQKHIGTNNIFVSMIGQYDEHALLHYFESQKARLVSRQPIHSSEQKIITSSRSLADRSSHVHFTNLGVQLVEREKPLRWIYNALNYYIGDGISSRLFRRFREDNTLAYSIWSNPSFYRDGAEYVVNLCSSSEKFQTVQDALLDEVANLYSITEEEWLIAKRRFISRLIGEIENPMYYAYWVGRHFSIADRLSTVEEAIGNVETITLDEIRDLLHESFSPERFVVVTVGPKIT